MRLNEQELRKKRAARAKNQKFKTLNQELDKKVPLIVKPGLTIMIRPDQDPESVRQKYLNS